MEEDYKTLYEKLSTQVEILIKESEKDKEIEMLKKTVEELSLQIKKYKDSASHERKKHYEKNREKIIEKVKEYNKTKTYDPEKQREYNKRYRDKLKQAQSE